MKKIVNKIKTYKPDLSQEKLKKSIKQLHKGVRKNVSKAIAAAFAFLIALAWKDVIVDIVNKVIDILKMPENTYLFRFVSALIVTIICVIGIVTASKITAKQEQ